MSSTPQHHPRLHSAIIPDPLTIPHDQPAANVAALLASASADGRPRATERASCAIVVRDGCPLGIITAPVALGLVGAADAAGAAAHIAAPVLSARRTDLASPWDAARLLRERAAGHLIVLDDDGCVAGLITPATLLPALDGPPAEAASATAEQSLVELNQELERRIAERTAALERSEARLRKSEAHLRAAQRIALLGSWEFDVASGEIVWSDEVYRIFERDPGLGPPGFEELLEYYHPDDRERHRTVVAEAIERIQPYNLDMRVLVAEGGARHIQARGEPVVDQSGVIVRLVGTILDITERKQVEDERRNLADRLSLAVRSAAIGIWDWDVRSDLLSWDQRMFELYGLDPADFSSAYDAWVRGLHPEDRAASERAIQQALRGEQEFDTEFRVVHPDGTIRDIKAYGLVQRGGDGEPLGMIGVNFDITERKRAEVRLRETSAQLAAANRELEAFAYSVSHDLRAPLRAIDGFSKALVEDYGHELSPEARNYLARIRGGVQRMSLLIDDLLRLSRISRGEMRLAHVSLSRQVQRLSAELQAQQPGRQVEWVIAPDVWAWVDASLMRVALENLLFNAWKFTSHHERARIEFGVSKRGERTVYFVRDDGAGFNPAYTAKLFGVFQRLHDAHEFPGTGVGLATVQRVIARHGGEIWAEGAIEQGATFSFTLLEGRA